MSYYRKRRRRRSGNLRRDIAILKNTVKNLKRSVDIKKFFAAATTTEGGTNGNNRFALTYIPVTTSSVPPALEIRLGNEVMIKSLSIRWRFMLNGYANEEEIVEDEVPTGEYWPQGTILANNTTANPLVRCLIVWDKSPDWRNGETAKYYSSTNNNDIMESDEIFSLYTQRAEENRGRFQILYDKTYTFSLNVHCINDSFYKKMNRRLTFKTNETTSVPTITECRQGQILFVYKWDNLPTNIGLQVNYNKMLTFTDV